VGGVRGLRRQRAPRGPGPGILRGHGREPDSVACRRGGIRGRWDDRCVRALRHPELGRLPGGAHVPCDRLLAADPTRRGRLLPAAPHGRAVGARAQPDEGSRVYTSESKVREMTTEIRDIENVVIVGSGPAGYTAALY